MYGDAADPYRDSHATLLAALRQAGDGRAQPDSREFLLNLFSYLPAPALMIVMAVPAHASAGIALPEPSGLFLLAMGVAGVVIGRQLSHRKRHD